MVRQVDIARQAGVSVMTVSRVLRDAPEISAFTKARIRRIAQELGYVPDVMARGLRTRCTRLLGVMVSGFADPVQGGLLAALEQQACESGYDLLVTQSQNQVDREAGCIRRCLARRVEGLFLVPVYRLAPTAAAYAELKECRVPVVLLGPRGRFCEGFPVVESDDTGASERLTQHLLGLGHERIAFLAGPVHSPVAQARFEGYRRALWGAGRQVDERLVFHAGSTVAEGAAAVAQLLTESGMPTAIQSVNDAVAMGAASFLLDRGWDIPRSISVAGCGDHPGSEHFRVPLTTIRQPAHALGVAAMETMLRLFRHERPENRRLPAELVLRASVAAPRVAAAACSICPTAQASLPAGG